jgi:hypothetical protein
MDGTTAIRLVAALLAIGLIAFVIYRRKSKVG